MHATGGRGVDIVLNSLSGELLHASWQCVAKNGKMMEIGKRDMLAHGHLALDGFQSNRTFYGVDIRDLGSVLPRYDFSSIYHVVDILTLRVVQIDG